MYGKNNYSAEVFLFDLKTKRWVVQPAKPSLNCARTSHACCAIGYTTFAFGGKNENGINNQLESLRLDYDGSPMSEVWTIMQVYDIAPRKALLMAPVGNDSLLIMGGVRGNSEHQCGGIVLNVESMRKVSTFDHSNNSTPFFCEVNQHYVDADGTIVALAYADGAQRLIRIDCADMAVRKIGQF
mmetsp:Transcript_47737/g.63059  ORF Transcript_47737/g.63059 Transcript_47737/m.63059 type:complete len:184 (-) Transcript_47737:153-704(-)